MRRKGIKDGKTQTSDSNIDAKTSKKGKGYDNSGSKSKKGSKNTYGDDDDRKPNNYINLEMSEKRSLTKSVTDQNPIPKAKTSTGNHLTSEQP